VKEVRSGLSAASSSAILTEYEVGDVIECYTLEKVQQKL
jgi:translation initiation factor IF-2